MAKDKVIRLFRSTGVAAPGGGTLAFGEPAYTEGDHKLHIGDNAGTGVNSYPLRPTLANVHGNGATAGSNVSYADTYKITNLVDGTADQDAATVAQVAAAVAGQQWQAPVSVGGYLGTRTITEINALSPVAGDVVVAGSAGTPTATGSDLLAIGDIAEYIDGTSGWQIIVAHAGGFPPDGTRALVSAGTLFAPLTDATDNGKIAQWDGASLTPALVTPADGWAVIVAGEGSVRENRQYTFDGVVPTGVWEHTGGVQSIDAGFALTKTGTTLDFVSDEAAGDGLEGDSGSPEKLRVKISDDSLTRAAGGMSLRLDAVARTTGGAANNPLIVTASNGVNVAKDGTSIVVNGSNALAVGTVDGGTFT